MTDSPSFFTIVQRLYRITLKKEKRDNVEIGDVVNIKVCKGDRCMDFWGEVLNDYRVTIPPVIRKTLEIREGEPVSVEITDILTKEEKADIEFLQYVTRGGD